MFTDLVSLEVWLLVFLLLPQNPTPDLTGIWRWTCCRGSFSGTWRIAAQQPDGVFSGEFSGRTAEDIGAIQGRVHGEQVEFTRKGTFGGQPFEQHWSGTISSSKVQGKLEAGEFSAERFASGPDAVNLLCAWRWTCCGGQFKGIWEISAQQPDGAFFGAFSGKTPQDIGSMQGRARGSKVEFVRSGTFDGQYFEQHWAGTVQGNTWKGRLEAGDFSAECGPVAAATPLTPDPGTGGGICYDPQTLKIMDEWLGRALPPQQPGESLHYDPWGRVIGKTRTGAIEYARPPSTRLTRCDWLWYYSTRLPSSNGLGTLREYVDLKK